MSRIAIHKKIDTMPDALIGMVAELLDKLVASYEIGQQSIISEEFTDEEIEELDRRYEEMIAKPEETISHEEIVKHIQLKHGL